MKRCCCYCQQNEEDQHIICKAHINTINNSINDIVIYNAFEMLYKIKKLDNLDKEHMQQLCISTTKRFCDLYIDEWKNEGFRRFIMFLNNNDKEQLQKTLDYTAEYFLNEKNAFKLVFLLKEFDTTSVNINTMRYMTIHYIHDNIIQIYEKEILTNECVVAYKVLADGLLNLIIKNEANVDVLQKTLCKLFLYVDKLLEEDNEDNDDWEFSYFWEFICKCKKIGVNVDISLFVNTVVQSKNAMQINNFIYEMCESKLELEDAGLKDYFKVLQEAVCNSPKKHTAICEIADKKQLLFLQRENEYTKKICSCMMQKVEELIKTKEEEEEKEEKEEKESRQEIKQNKKKEILKKLREIKGKKHSTVPI